MKKILDRAFLDSIAQKFGDAFYLLEPSVFMENYKELKDAFQLCYPRCNIAYSYKTNYTPTLVSMVDMLGGYAEVVSDMEMEVAIKSKVKPDHIIWNGPVKNMKKVEELLLAGGTVNVDSVIEYEQIKKLADSNKNTTFSIGIRCNYDVGDGVLSRFGFDVEGKDFDETLRSIQLSSNIKLISLHAHFAKRLPEYWTARAEGMLRVYDYVLHTYGIQVDRLDIGGGIYGKMPEKLSKQLGVHSTTFADYASRAAKLFKEHFEGVENKPWLFIEPGSALVGDCVRFVCRVKSIKEIRGKVIATTIGSQKNISMSGINPPIEIVDGGGDREAVTDADIVGFTCIENDVLQKNYSGKLGVGDYLIIENCGSYSLVMKPPFILPNFAVLNIDNDEVEVIKRAECFDDLFCTFSF